VYQAIETYQKREAEVLRSMTFEQIGLLCRLASDERMKKVWRELYRKTRGGKQFLNPARAFGDALRGSYDPQNQDTAAREFFGNAFRYAAWPAPLMTREDYKSRHKSLITIVARLREDAQNLSSLGLGEHVQDLEGIAAACEKCSLLQAPIHPPMVTRSRGDQVVRGYILRMTILCDMLFDKELHGTVATTTGVALSKEISGDRVRDMVRAYVSRLET
jgi:hypothetical protein